MSAGHSEASFNHSCLKVPVDSLSRMPTPKYERKLSAKNFEKREESQEKWESSSSDIHANFKSIKSYLEFYESIPDYTDLHHLSNEEFYCRLQSLKITQKRFCGESVVSQEKPEFQEFKDFKTRCNMEKQKENKIAEPESCCNYCCQSKNCCNLLDNERKIDSKACEKIKRPLPKINIISENENVSDFYEPENKKHSGYEADRESSTLQPGDRPRSSYPKTEEKSQYEKYNKRPRSLPLNHGCEYADLCPRFQSSCFGTEECCSGLGSTSCFLSKKKETSTKKSQPTFSRPVPLTSRIPLYDKIVLEKEAKRRAVHDLYSEKLRSSVKPFSFTKREEEEKERHRMVCSNPDLTSTNPPLVRFKAKPIPKNLFSNYAYDRMKEEEFYRALKKRIRAEELLKSSSLPPSMALREKKYRSKSLDFLDYRSPKKSRNKICGYRRAYCGIKKEIEFDDKSRNDLYEKRKSGWLSKSKRISSATDSSTEFSPYESMLEPCSRRKTRPNSAFSSSRNNLASVLRIENSRKRLEKEMEEKLRASRLKDEAKLKERIVRMSPAWKALNYDKDEDLAVRLAQRREEERLKQENHERLMESMYGRVYSMPPMFDNERFNTCKSTRVKCSANCKNSMSHYSQKEKHKTDDGRQGLQDEGRDSKSLLKEIPNGHQVDCRSSESFTSTASCEKADKKVYESDEANHADQCLTSKEKSEAEVKENKSPGYFLSSFD